MDRRVKERLVGASILVVLIVLIVPELLSGPAPRGAAVQPAGATPPAHAPEPVRNVTVDLATSKAPEHIDAAFGGRKRFLCTAQNFFVTVAGTADYTRLIC